MISLLFAVAMAGEMPTQIPYDTCWITDTLYVEDRPVIQTYPVLFILKDEYDAKVLGMENEVAARQIERKLETVKAILQAQEKK